MMKRSIALASLALALPASAQETEPALSPSEDEAERRVPIRSVRLGNELTKGPAPSFEYHSTESESFAAYAKARANRRDPFFIAPAGGADIRSIPVPIRRKAQAE